MPPPTLCLLCSQHLPLAAFTASVLPLSFIPFRWQCERDLGPFAKTRPGEQRFPYPALLQAVDDFIDALLTPKNEVGARWQCMWVCVGGGGGGGACARATCGVLNRVECMLRSWLPACTSPHRACGLAQPCPSPRCKVHCYGSMQSFRCGLALPNHTTYLGASTPPIHCGPVQACCPEVANTSCCVPHLHLLPLTSFPRHLRSLAPSPSASRPSSVRTIWTWSCAR